MVKSKFQCLKRLKITMLNLNKDKKYLLACSYGPDSMALFYLLLENGFKFDVAHVNYHLRKESDVEEMDLRSYCEEKSIKLFVFDNQEKINKNIEARCREIRYSFFKSLFEPNGYDALIVAHQQDDHIETYLLQKERKNLVNYFGIAPETVINGMTVLRPLLNLTKADTLNICESNNVPYAIDKTNLLPLFKRNKIRISIINKLLPRTRMGLLEEIKVKNEWLKDLFVRLDSIDNSVSTLLRLNSTEFAYYLTRKTRAINPLCTITYSQSKEVEKILVSNKPNISVYLEKYNVCIEKAYDVLNIKKKSIKKDYCIVVDEPKVIDNEFFYANLLTDTANRNIALSDYPLTIRSFKANDKYHIKDYEVLVRRLFIDWKMPLAIRSIWPIILNKNGQVIYIPRYQKDFVPDDSTNFYVKECFTLK